MYKIVIESLCSCKNGKSALDMFKSLNTGQTSYCVRRFSKKQYAAPSYSNEDREHLKDEAYGSRTKHKKSFKIPQTRTKEYKTDGYEKQAKELDAYDNDWSDGQNLDSDTFGAGVGKFQEISDKHKLGRSGSKSRSKDNLPNNWADEFGSMSPEEDKQMFDVAADTTDLQDDPKLDKIYGHVRLARYERRHDHNWYARKIQKFGKAGEIRKAIEVFDEWMLKRDRVKPTQFEYTVLMKLLADVGYTDKVFQLYRDMLPRLGFADDHVYTCLFNACANSPWPEYGLKRAHGLRHQMLYRDRKPNYITYLSMIKAFGYCGDINTAFLIADEAAQLNVTSDLFHNLLSACISDKKAGFRHAIVVWRKFSALGIKPNLTSYKLLLHCVTECGIGDPNLLRRLFNQPVGFTGRRSRIGNEQNQIVGVNYTETTGAMQFDRTDEKSLITDNSEKKNIKQKEKKTLKAIRKSFIDLDKLMWRHGFNDIEGNNLPTQGDNSKSQGQTASAVSYKESGDNVTDSESSSETASVMESGDNVTDSESSSETASVMESKEWWEQDIFENSLSMLPVQDSHTTLNALSNDQFPDILDPYEDFKYLVDIKALKGKHERLDLFGGLEGVLHTLEARNITPDMSTFILLARSIREDSVDILLSRMWAMGIKPNIEVYNQCIWETVIYSHETAWSLYNRLRSEELIPDVKTYSSLAMTCSKPGQALALIEDMLGDGIMPNTYTLVALIRAANFRFECKTEILNKMSELGIKCNTHIVKSVERDVQRARMKISTLERKGENTEYFKKSLNRFLHFYDKWLQTQDLAEEVHPWQTFKPVEDTTSN